LVARPIFIERQAVTTALRITYFISAYRSAGQLERLVTTLRRGDPTCAIVIHDSFPVPLDPRLFADMADVHVIRTHTPIVWGDLTVEAARWNVFSWILDNVDTDWVMLLSEQDYPIAPLSGLHVRLAASGADAVLAGIKLDDIADPDQLRDKVLRYRYRYLSLPALGIERRLPRLARRVLAGVRRRVFDAVNRTQRTVVFYRTPDSVHLPTRIGLRTRRTPFDTDFPCWCHRCWYALSRNAMQRVVDYVDTHPDFVRYYKRTVIPVESATGTIIFNDATLAVDHALATGAYALSFGAPLHAIRFSDVASGRPDVFSTGDLDYLLSSGAYFARKFEHDDDVLDELDKTIFATGDHPTS
jgi:hypothetical protein